MSTKRIIALALIVLGLVLIHFGYRSSQGLDDQLSEAVTGNYTDETIAWIVAGGISLIAGVAVFRRR